MKQYRKGLYGANTPLALVEFIEEELGLAKEYLGFHRARKLTIQYGNPLTGKAWIDSPTSGYIEIDPTNPTQLIIKSSTKRKAYDVVLMNNIVRIASGTTVHYRHPLFHIHTDQPPIIQESNTDVRAFRRIVVGRNDSSNQTAPGDNPREAPI
jgi:citrate lyase synthetase